MQTVAEIRLFALRALSSAAQHSSRFRFSFFFAADSSQFRNLLVRYGRYCRCYCCSCRCRYYYDSY